MSEKNTSILNETIKTQLNHRSIRNFTDEPVSEEIMQTLFLCCK